MPPEAVSNAQRSPDRFATTRWSVVLACGDSQGDEETARKALAAFQQQHRVHASGMLDQATWDVLVGTSAEHVLGEYTITEADTRGPFAPDISEEIEDWARLKRARG